MDNKKEIVELARDIAKLLKSYGNPHTTIKITTTDITMVSDEWKELTELGEKYINGSEGEVSK